MRELFENNFIRVALGLIVGLLAIIYFNPPHTACQSQIDIYQAAFHNYEKAYQKDFTICTDHPDSGGCLEFFDLVNKLDGKLNEVSQDCQVELRHDNFTRIWIKTAMEVFVKAAWGSRPPPSYLYRNGWLETNQVAEFCKLKHRYMHIFGDDAWDSLASDIMASLPGASGNSPSGDPASTNSSNLSRNDIWDRSIMSDPCTYGY